MLFVVVIVKHTVRTQDNYTIITVKTLYYTGRIVELKFERLNIIIYIII